MASKVIQSESQYQELENQQLIINIFEKFEFNLNFRNMTYEDLSILNNEFNDLEWQPFLGLFFGRHLFLIINWSK